MLLQTQPPLRREHQVWPQNVCEFIISSFTLNHWHQHDWLRLGGRHHFAAGCVQDSYYNRYDQSQSINRPRNTCVTVSSAYMSVSDSLLFFQLCRSFILNTNNINLTGHLIDFQFTETTLILVTAPTFFIVLMITILLIVVLVCKHIKRRRAQQQQADGTRIPSDFEDVQSYEVVPACSSVPPPVTVTVNEKIGIDIWKKLRARM